MFRSKSQFERVFEKATSNLLLEPDLDSNLQLCDMIRGGDIKAREAAAIIKNRVVEEKNPHVLYFAVAVLDVVMKNCGEGIHEEILTESFMEQVKELVKSTGSEQVKNKLLEMVQEWGLGFKDKTNLKVASNLYNIMKAEGYKFPSPPSSASDMFKSEKAPTWSDGDECFKCKTEFGFVQRKHHCRACGGIFCGKCSSKTTIIPKFGIEKEVRVCDGCFEKINKKGKSNSDLPAEYLNSALAKQSQEPPKRDEAQLKEEEELQLALALSLDEQENKNRIRREQIEDSVYTAVSKPAPAQSSPARVMPDVVDPEEDPDLARYLNRSYWDKKKDEQEKQSIQSNAKSKTSSVKTSNREIVPEVEVVDNDVVEPPKQEEKLQNGEVADNEELLRNLRTSVEIFMNRMKSNQQRGRSIANDSTVQTLFQSINNMHPMLIQSMNDLEENRLNQESLQDKLVQLRDARAALDALRTEHAEKLKRAAEEAERQRQIQMAQKLEIMRQKKQEYLAYQRQLALQRMQEQEAARQARLEQQKQFIQQRAMQPSMMIAGYNTPYAPAPPSGEVPPNPAGMMSGGYMYQGYSAPAAAQHAPLPYQNMAPPAGQQYPAAMQSTGYVQASTYPSTYDAPAQQMATSPSSIPGQPAPDAYNMAGVNAALPGQAPMNGGVPQQVVATAPPPTPQPGPGIQQMNPPMQSNDPMTSAYHVTAPQQHYYEAPPPTTQDAQHPVSVPQGNDSLLISFD